MGILSYCVTGDSISPAKMGDHIMLDLDEWALVLSKMLRFHFNISEDIKKIVQTIRVEMKPELIPLAEEKSNFGKVVKKAIREMWALEYEVDELQTKFAESIGTMDLDNLDVDFIEDMMHDLTAPDVATCEAFCKINQGEGCKYWAWSREKKTCNLYDSAEKQCNIAFGPSDGAPGECGTTQKPEETTIGSTASPGYCDVTCPEVGMELFEDCNNCGGYVECYNGVMTTKTCPNCYLFDGAKGYCNQPTQVACGSRPEDEDCSAETKPGDCPFDNGYFKDVHNCRNYFICKNGVAESMSCKNGTFDGLYDYNLEWCNWQDKVDCEDRPICTGDPPEYKNCQCQGAETVDNFQCPNSPNVEVFIDPYNCQHIIVCQAGSQDDYYCESNQFGDDQTGTCKDDPSVCRGKPICNNIQDSTDCYCNNN